LSDDDDVDVPPLMSRWTLFWLALVLVLATSAIVSRHRPVGETVVLAVVLGGWEIGTAYRTRRLVIRRIDDKAALAEARARRKKSPPDDL
jgi:hypothetical protein